MDRIKERPILFSAPMVRALLDGSKTQTRRVIKPQPTFGDVAGLFAAWSFKKPKSDGRLIWPAALDQILAACPYGQPGDRLWVRETWRSVPMICLNDGKRSNWVEYAAGKRVLPYGKPPAIWDVPKHGGMKWSPSIHMFRKDSRITLEITGVRVERLQDISGLDALEEGVEKFGMHYRDYSGPDKCIRSSFDSYQTLWESINGPGSWDLNPWVWVVEFERITA